MSGAERGDPVVRGDANANAIVIPASCGDGGTEHRPTLTTGTAGPQDKVVIWGTDSQCDDPELAEFEMLECQELETYLVEDFVGLAEQRSRPSPGDAQQKAERKSGGNGPMEQGVGTSNPDVGDCVTRTDLSSENDVFVSCVSTMSSLGGSLASALDTSGRTSGPYRTFSEDLTLSSSIISDRVKVPPLKPSRHATTPTMSTALNRRDVNMNRNATSVLSGDIVLEAQQINNRVPPSKQHIPGTEEHKGNLNQRPQREQDKDGFTGTADEHEDSNKKVDKGTQADETPDMNDNPPLLGSKGTQSSIEPMKNQASIDRLLNKQKSFDRTLKKQPSFESTLKKQGSFDNSFKKQGSFENSHAMNASSLERRKPWGSPSRTVSPVPSKTISSPKRKPSGSPAKIRSTRAPSQERGESPLRNTASVKHPTTPKVGVNSSIPKPIANPPQKETDLKKTSSPPQKPKNVRPKIITYVRKGPQAKPDAGDVSGEIPAHRSPQPPSSHPSSAPAGGKDPKVGVQMKDAPALCSSNLLFDKFRQEMQKSGHCPPGPGPGSMVAVGVKPPSSSSSSSSSPHRGSGKPESLHTVELSHLQEHPAETGAMYRSPRTMKPQLGIGAVARQQPSKNKVPSKVQRSTHGQEEPSGENRKPGHAHASLATPTGPLTGPSGLRPPGFSVLPPGRLASFGFARSGSLSSVSSNQSGDSGPSQ
ncbi:hypothetical protein CRUP_029066, partial [Coryphaenoides rupestris]